MRVRRVVVSITQERTVTKRIHSQIEESKTNESIYTFSYPETEISFKVSQTDTNSPDNCFVKISGVSTNTYSVFDTEKNKKYNGTQRVDVFYGYDDDLSLVFSGTIDRVTYAFENGAQSIMMLITKNSRKFNKMIKSVSMSGSQTLKSAVDEICKTHGYTAKYGAGNFESIGVGKVCITGTIKDGLKSILPSGYDYYCKEDEVFVYSLENTKVTREIVFHSKNGLLAFPTEDSNQKATTIKTILVPNIESGMVIKIPVDDVWYSFDDTGVYKEYVVKNYSSSFGNGIGVSEFECEGGTRV